MMRGVDGGESEMWYGIAGVGVGDWVKLMLVVLFWCCSSGGK